MQNSLKVGKNNIKIYLKTLSMLIYIICIDIGSVFFDFQGFIKNYRYDIEEKNY